MELFTKIIHGRYLKRTVFVFAVLMIFAPVFVVKDIESLKNIGYLGFLVANYFGYGIFVLPFMIESHNDFLLVLIAGFGNTIDEFFAWLAGRVTQEFESKREIHKRVEKFVMEQGLWGIFVMGILPLPGILYDIAAFVAGHYRMPYIKLFLASFLGKLLRWVALLLVVKNFLAFTLPG